jgi:hypothetical protein
VALHVLGGGTPLEHPGGAGEEADLVDRGRDLLGHRQVVRLAGVLHLEVHELRGPRLDGIGDTEQRELALRGGGVAPGGERRRGGGVGSVHVLAAAAGGPGHDLRGGGVHEVVGGVGGGRDVLPADEVAQQGRGGRPVVHGCRHGSGH